MRRVGAYEAKTKLPSLLDDVAAGQSVTITRHGTPIARLVPADRQRETARSAAEQLLEFRRAHRLAGLSIRELIDEGRRR
ncbi:MAG TPA: type II toxin-antitoxin system prevent-host-death family antitoxin [Candidatus Limnocylindrales bacterium]|nr:type II toxin-antitoxin system prevent-host-death family antitoxin [Candidatus Limnocylindrales bacterium]